MSTYTTAHTAYHIDGAEITDAQFALAKRYGFVAAPKRSGYLVRPESTSHMSDEDLAKLRAAGLPLVDGLPEDMDWHADRGMAPAIA